MAEIIGETDRYIITKSAGVKYAKDKVTGEVLVGKTGTMGPQYLERKPTNASSLITTRGTNIAADIGALTTQIKRTQAVLSGTDQKTGITTGPNIGSLSGGGSVQRTGGGTTVSYFNPGPGGITSGMPGPGSTFPGGTSPFPSTGNEWIDALLGLGYQYLTGGGSNAGPGTGGAGAGLTGASSTCPTGYKWDGSQCVAEGATGAVQRFLPGGATGTMADIYGDAVLGFYGAGLIPAQVGTVVSTKTGVTNPILKCPRGMVLGKDNVCYKRNAIGRTQRKWNPGRKPMFTGGDMNAIAKVEKLRETYKKAGSTFGFTCRKKK